MDKSAAVICYAFLEKLALEQRQVLLQHFSDEEVQKFTLFIKPENNALLGMTVPEEELAHMHFSWLAPFLRSLPEGDIKFFLGSLSEEQQNGLKQSLLFSNHIPTPSVLGRQFLRKKLYSFILEKQDILPISCLPSAPLNILLTMNHEELLSLIELLCMHDLAIEIRQIIDTTKLKSIYSMLSKEQTHFLKTLIHRKEPVVFKKMELTKWDGKPESLASTLEQRGINRLAKALYIEDPSLLWYISHRLDTERGTLLVKLVSPLDHPRAALLLSEQILALVRTLKNQDS